MNNVFPNSNEDSDAVFAAEDNDLHNKSIHIAVLSPPDAQLQKAWG